MTIFGKTIVGILLAGVLGGGAYYTMVYMQNDVAQGEMAATVEEEKKAETEEGVPIVADGTPITEKDMSFSELMKKTGSYECTVKQSIMGVSTDGKVAIKGGRVSATFTTSMQGQTITTNMIAKDDYTYTWSSMSPTGMKVKMTTTGTTTPQATTQTSGSYAWNNSTIGSYSCVAKDVSDSVFNIPTSITFNEMK